MIPPLKILIILLLGIGCWVGLRTIGSNKTLLAPPCTETVRQQHANNNNNKTKQTPSFSAATAKASSTSTINFRLQPDMFVEQLTGCFDDKDCRIYYYHFGKSGGTGVLERMEHLYPPRLDSCCNADMMNRFHKDPVQHCSIKFSSYEISGRKFLDDVLPTCHDITNQGRSIVLVTFREPIQRTLSYIHQMCNKNFQKRPKVLQQACQRCSYRKDEDYWQEFLENANDQYQQLYEVASTTSLPDGTVLAVDLMDLSQLYRDLFHATNHKAFSMKTRANPESTARCNFGLTSEMLRVLRPANDIYRNLTLGIYQQEERMIVNKPQTAKNKSARKTKKTATKVRGKALSTTTTTQHVLPPQCQPYVKRHTLDLSHGRYIRVKGREAPYNHTSCFLMKPRYNCATTDKTAPKAWEYKLILQSNPLDDSTICDFESIVESLGGPAALPNKQVAILGNSFLRQVFESLACKYQDQLTAAKVTENPASVSLGALAKRKGKPYTRKEYGNIISVPVDQRPIPLCAGVASQHAKYFEPDINLTTPHLTTKCSDELAMLEFVNSFKVFYNFRPDTLKDTIKSYQTLIGLNISEMDYIAFNTDEHVHIRKTRPVLKASMDNYKRILPALEKFQRRDLRRWFGARNPWISDPPDMHPCLPGVPDDESALFLFSVIFDIHKFIVP